MRNAFILADSLNLATLHRLTTFLLPRFPKILAQELLTHRVFSRNSASSRAIPIQKVIAQIKIDPYIPTWTRNARGMAGTDELTEDQKNGATRVWLQTMEGCIHNVEDWLLPLSIAKQDANRLLEPFMRIPIVVTATDWDNFFALRTAPDAQPDFRAVALEMQHLYTNSVPQELQSGGWHIPFLQEDTKDLSLLETIKISSARCARCSYTTHWGEFDLDADFQLHDRLVQSKHWSPLEHQAKALSIPVRCRNLNGWMSYRAHIEDNISIVNDEGERSIES